jgi:hypothetical protein
MVTPPEQKMEILRAATVAAGKSLPRGSDGLDWEIRENQTARWKVEGFLTRK